MKVTDLDYAMENRLIKKLDLMIKRCVKKDILLIVEGSEGEGKTNASETIAYYIRYKTGRNINMFFKLSSMIEFAKKTSGQIIIWDEPAIDSLSTDWYKSKSKDLTRLLMVCRKKRHFFIFNFVRFYKFNEYIVVDRSHGMIHIYTRSDGQQGRFVYFMQKDIERLYLMYRTKKIRGYRQCKKFGGWIPFLEKHLTHMDMTIEGHPHCTIDDYERFKDEAIESIGETPSVKSSRVMLQRNALLYVLNKECKMKQKDIAKRIKQLTNEEYKQSNIAKAISPFT